MERPSDYTTAMTNLKWDNAEDYNAIMRYVRQLRSKIKELETSNDIKEYKLNEINRIVERIKKDFKL